MSLNKSVFCFLLVLIVFFCNSSVAQTLSCPTKIAITASLTEKHPGWQTFEKSSPHYFDRLSLTAGPPDENATLVPDVSDDAKMGWDLAADHEYWLNCHYLASSIRLAQKIPAGVKQCSVTFKKVGSKAMQSKADVVCVE